MRIRPDNDLLREAIELGRSDVWLLVGLSAVIAGLMLAAYFSTGLPT